MTTKKDFIAAAKELKAMQDRTEAAKVAEMMVKIFSNQNPLFDKQRFLTACGL